MGKLSKYVHFIVDGEYTVLFNLKNESFIILRKELEQRVHECEHDIDSLATIHPNLFRQMNDDGMIVASNENETAQLIEEWKRQDKDPTYFSVIINPTLNCNLDCWYCYENHSKKPMMSVTVLNSIKNLIERKVQEKMLRTLNVSFFGGEPLLGFNAIILPLLDFAARLCKSHAIRLTSNFTTNGTLLTDIVLDYLDSIQLIGNCSFQISLDGSRNFHNQSRIGKEKKPTYDTIIDSIKRAAIRKYYVSVRLNYTTENILTFIDVLDDMKELTQEAKQFISFSFQRIWQDQVKGIKIQDRLEEAIHYYKEEGFRVDSDKIYYRHCCYADRENSVIINYDGSLFKCTARDFTPDKSEGILDANGILQWNNLYEHRMHIKYSSPICLRCSILPLCNGGCTQGKLESTSIGSCYRHFNDDDKNNIIIKRLSQLIENSHRNKPMTK